MNILVSALKPKAFHQVDLVATGLVLAARQIDVPVTGTMLQLAWPQISGATEIVLESANVTLLPPSGPSAGLYLGHLKGTHSGDRCKVVIPLGPRPVRSLYLGALRANDADQTPLPDQAALQAQGLRLAVAVAAGGVLAPVSMAVPSISGSPGQPPYTTPPLLTGASYDNYRLVLPDITADEIWLMVVDGDDPEDFAPTSFALDYVSAQAVPSPVDISLLDADGAPFYASTGPVTALTLIDAKNAVQRALEAVLGRAAQPVVGLTVKGRTPGKLGTYGIVAAGEVRRVFDAKIAVTLEGAAVTPHFPGAPLDAQAPSSATADLVIEHLGLRLHPLSDVLPTAAGGEAGRVVSMDSPQWRPLPSAGLRGEELRRVGIVGYGLEAAKLSLRVLQAAPDGSPIAPPDLVTATCDIAPPDLKRPHLPSVFWFDLSAGLLVENSIGFEVSAASGRFLWIAQAENLLVRLAVTHDLTGGEIVQIGSQGFQMTGPRTNLNGATFAPGIFAAPPRITSDHFATVTLSRLTLGYAP